MLAHLLARLLGHSLAHVPAHVSAHLLARLPRPRLARAAGAAAPLALLLGLVALTVTAWHLKHPLLYRLRPVETPLLLGLSIGLAYAAGRRLGRRAHWRQGIVPGLALAGALLTLSLTLANEVLFQWQKYQVLAGGPVLRRLGSHFVVGFRDFADLRPLAERGLIGGIYVSRANLRGRTRAEIQQEIAELQALRRGAGLPPLFVAADQEGGSVAHLSPLVEAQPPLASLVGRDAPAAQGERARQYGRRQGRALAELGINLNLSPVVDLKPVGGRTWKDRHTLLDRRAIAADPAPVTAIASGYSRGLAESGVQPTVKHFPGLARVRGDTHLVRARLDGPPAALARDWQPFRTVTAESGAAMMLAHVVLPAVDARYPVSTSRAVAHDLLRRQWGYAGLLITDDLNMGAVYADGIGPAATRALDAGVDLILVSYDPDQYYRALYAAARGWRQGAINALRETESAQRLAEHWRHWPGTPGR